MKTTDHSRRTFLKIAAGATGLAWLPVRGVPAFALSNQTGWRPGLKINPWIDNVKALCCYDEAMVVNKIAGDFVRQNEGVNATLVAKNMDDIAMRLTNTSSAAAAWQAIFRKPVAKQWNQVRAAIKVHCANPLNMPRIAVAGKVCSELIRLGIPATGITIYDSRYNAAAPGNYADSQGNPIAGLPPGVVVSNVTGSGPEVPVGGGTMQCTSVIATSDGGSIAYTADILVNIASNAGIDASGSDVDLCMHNHTGTLKFASPTAAELIDINQAEAIIGVGTADIPCRQQLCIVDSLWATAGNSGSFTHVPCRIVMGVLPPILDFLVAKNIREPQRIMNAPPNAPLISSWVSAFGYATTDCQWIEFTPSTGVYCSSQMPDPKKTPITVLLGNGRGAQFFMPRGDIPAIIDIFTIDGRLVHHASIPTTRTDRSVSISLLPPGFRQGTSRYAIRCRMGNEERTVLAASGF